LANNATNLGNLAFTPEEAAAIAQAEAAGAGQFPQERHGWHWIFTAILVLVVAWIFASLLATLRNDEPSKKREELQAALRVGRSDSAPATAMVAITRRAVHLRRDSSLTSQSLGVIPAGQPVIVKEKRLDGFHRVDYGTQFGYVAAAYLVTSENVVVVPKTAGRIGDIEGLARLREQPQLAAPVITALSAGTTVVVLGFTEDGWVFVTTDEHTGFVWGGLIAACPVLPFQPTREGPNALVLIGGRIVGPL
jgi:hypothetical protein